MLHFQVTVCWTKKASASRGRHTHKDSDMEEIQDFEGFTLDDCLLSKEYMRNREKVLERNYVCHHSSTTEVRKARPGIHSIKRETRTDILRFWQVREQYLFDTPHTAYDHGTWFEKIMADLCDDHHQKLELTYQRYNKVVDLESSVNIIMFITDCSEITTQCLLEQLVPRITSRINKSWLESTLMLSPLFSFNNIRKVWKRKGISHCEGKNVIFFSLKRVIFIVLTSLILKVAYHLSA